MTEELVITYPPPETLDDADFERMMLTREAYTAMRNARISRERHAPKVGDMAPDFRIARLAVDGTHGGDPFQLSETRGRPVTLIFGSYT
ncbi:MAG: hypothetical protein OXT06_21540 [Rhodospirillaceae bacterium]|nr:hypothetical protein [Rhodospirillaceae bacterium]MDD9914577.1 hypothetical protein [Rhodospirillaceae bacterium]